MTLLRPTIAISIALATITGGAIALSVYEAFPHQATPTAAAPQGWSYPFSCCASFDCRSTKTGEVTERADGYHTPSGEIIPYRDKRVKNSPDGEMHWCAHQAGLDAGKTICLFVPPRGV